MNATDNTLNKGGHKILYVEYSTLDKSEYKKLQANVKHKTLNKHDKAQNK